MIICNGHPKSGTNLLLKSCSMMGFRDSSLFAVSLKSGTPYKVRKINLDQTKEPKEKTFVDKFDNSFFCHAHLAPGSGINLSQHKMINIFRDPKNTLISYLRWADRRNKGFKKTKNDLKKLITDGYCGMSFFKSISQYYEYKSNKNVLCVNYENLLEIDTLKNISKFIGADSSLDLEYISQNAYGNGKKLPNGKDAYHALSSWSGNSSNWQDWWDDEIDALWNTTLNN